MYTSFLRTSCGQVVGGVGNFGRAGLATDPEKANKIHLSFLIRPFRLHSRYFPWIRVVSYSLLDAQSSFHRHVRKSDFGGCQKRVEFCYDLCCLGIIFGQLRPGSLFGRTDAFWANWGLKTGFLKAKIVFLATPGIVDFPD